MERLNSAGPRFKDYFKKEKTALKIFGTSFDEHDSLLYRIYSFLMLFLLNFTYPVLETMEIFKHDFEVVADMLMYVFGVYVCTFKVIAVLKNRKKFGELLGKLEKQPFTVDLERGGEQEEKLLDTCLKTASIQTYTYWIITFITVGFTMGYSLFWRMVTKDSTKWKLGYGPLTVLNITYSPNYELTWCYQNVAVLSVAVYSTTIDVLMAAVLVHITYHFMMLQNSIRRLTVNSCREMCKDNTHHKLPSATPTTNMPKIPWKYLRSSLKRALEYHVAILEIASEMERLFSNLFLFVFLGTLGILCFLIFTSLLPQHRGQIMRHVGEMIITSFEVLMICFWGEIIAYESQQVGAAAYEVHFTGTDLRFQKGLAMIIRRSQDSTRLTAGMFANINLATFAWIMRTSYSAFMVISSARASVY